MGLNWDDMFPDPGHPAATPDDDGERAHIARAAAALGDPDLAPALKALDCELDGLGESLESAAITLAAAASDIHRTRDAIRILTQPGAGS